MSFIDTVVTAKDVPQVMQDRIEVLTVRGFALHLVQKTADTFFEGPIGITYRAYLSRDGYVKDLRTKTFCGLPNEKYELDENSMSSRTIALFFKVGAIDKYWFEDLLPISQA